MGIVQLLRRRYGWVDRLLTRAETYTSLWEQYGDTIKPVLRLGGAAVLGLWTAVEGSWLAIGIAVAVVVYAALSMAANARRAGLPALAAPPASPPPTGILPGPDAEQQSFIQEITASLEELQGTVRRLDRSSDSEAVARSVNALIGKQEDLAARIGAVAGSARAAAEAAGIVRAQLLPQIDKLAEESEFFRKRFDRFEADVRKRFGVRDADARLRELAGPIASRSERLLKADPETFPDLHTWRSEMAEWQTGINEFWAIVERWDQSWPDGRPPPSLRTLLHASHEDYVAVNGSPGAAIPDDFAAQQQWRFVAIVSARHRRHAERVMGRMRDAAREGLYQRG